MGYYEFPHTRNYDTDLGYLIDWFKTNKNKIEENTAITIEKALSATEDAIKAYNSATSASNSAALALELKNETEALKNLMQDKIIQIDTNTNRINNLATIDQGSITTTADAELVDIRVGANGITYPSAGGAVRGQINELNNDLDSLIDTKNLELENILPFDFQYIDTNKMLDGYWTEKNGNLIVTPADNLWCISVKNLPSGKYSAQTYAEYQSFIRNKITGELKNFHDIGFSPSNTTTTMQFDYPFDLYLTVRHFNNAIWYRGDNFIPGKSWEYGAHNIGTPKVFYCGQNRKYTKLKDAIEAAEKYFDSILYVDAGTYDLITEFGPEYFENFDGSGYYNDGAWGIVLKNRIHIIFAENAKVVCNYTGNNQNVQRYFSAFNAGIYGFTLENANIDTTNIRYCVHDDRGDSTETGYINKYIRCRMHHNSINSTGWGAAQCIGGGFGNNGDILIEDCYFKAEGYNYPITYHNSAHGGNAYKAHCVVKGNYIEGGMRFNSTGISDLVTDVYVHDNAINGYGILIGKTTEDSHDNVLVRMWNNARNDQ